jgi:hypothetical protein
MRIAVVVVALALVLASAGCAKKAAESGLKPAEKPAASASDTGTAQATETPLAPTGQGGTQEATSSGGSGAKGTGGGTSGAGKKGETPAEGIKIKILWWNDTQSKPIKGLEIVYGSSVVKPTAKKSGSGTIGPVPLDKAQTLRIYPTGRSAGSPLIFRFRVSDVMEPNSETDAIHVEIRDEQIRVLGNPVDGFSQAAARP